MEYLKHVRWRRALGLTTLWGLTLAGIWFASSALSKSTGVLSAEVGYVVFLCGVLVGTNMTILLGRR